MWKKLLVILAGVVCFLASSTIAHEKEQYLVTLTERSSNGVLELSSEDYTKYVIHEPRPYKLFTLYTSIGQYCAECNNSIRLFEKVAESYKDSKKYISSDKRQAIFFIKVVVDSQRDIFMLHDIKTVPHIGFSTANFASAFKQVHPYPPPDFLHFPQNGKPQQILHFVNDKAGENVKLIVSTADRVRLFVKMVGLLVGLVVGGIVFVILARKWPVVILPFVAVVYCLSGCGLIHSVNHGMPWEGIDMMTKTTQFFHPGARQQYMGEGILMSVLASFAGIVLALGFYLAEKPWVRRHKMGDTITVVAFVLFAVASAQLYKRVQFKNPWFHPTFFLNPIMAKQGPLHVDRGNTF